MLGHAPRFEDLEEFRSQAGFDLVGARFDDHAQRSRAIRDEQEGEGRNEMPDVDLAIASGIWLFLQADQCGVARNARLTPVESIDRPAISPASLMSLACSSRAV